LFPNSRDSAFIMILLDYQNLILQDKLTEYFSSEKPEAVEMIVVDFDGVSYHLSNPIVNGKPVKTRILLSLKWTCFSELVNYGAQDILAREYGSYVVDVEPGYDFTLEFDLEKEIADKDILIKKVALLKRNALAAPFERAFAEQHRFEDEHQANPEATLMSIHYRPDEAIYVQASQDRVTVIFSTLFKEETDRILGKVFLQEFVDARRRHSIQSAPQVLYSNREPPLEIRHLPELAVDRGESVGFVTFVLFPRQFSAPDIREETISRIQIFRDYLHYHIKCSKAYMHSRMRTRVAEFLKVLNRAKPEVINVEKKTVTGRTFRRT